MAELTLRVHGIREVNRAFRQIDRKLALEFGGDMKEAAAPVVGAAQEKVTQYAGASVRTIRAKRAGPAVYVEQSARKVTGQRADFGSLQMRTVLIPALDDTADEVFTNVENVLDKYAILAGF